MMDINSPDIEITVVKFDLIRLLTLPKTDINRKLAGLILADDFMKFHHGARRRHVSQTTLTGTGSDDRVM